MNCRYSDCQFSMTSTMNADDVTKRPSDIVVVLVGDLLRG